jgi:hypothetical protein
MRTITDLIADSFERHRRNLLHEVAAVVQDRLDRIHRDVTDQVEDEIETSVADRVAELRLQVEQE